MAASAAKRIIEGVQGDDWFAYAFRWSVADPAGPFYRDQGGALKEIAEGQSVDDDDRFSRIPIVSARMQFRKSATSRRALVTLTEEDGLDLSEPGAVYPTLTPEQTALLHTGVWDLEVVADSGQRKTLALGTYRFIEDATR